MTASITLHLPEGTVRELACMRVAATLEFVPSHHHLNSSERDQLILAAKAWVEDHPPPVKVEVEFTAEEIEAMRGCWTYEGHYLPISTARRKILDALSREG